MAKSFKIGQKEYKFKKDAIAHYRTILKSYDFGESLNDTDYDALIDLLDYDYSNSLNENNSLVGINEDGKDNQDYIIESNEIEESELVIEDIKVSKVQFNKRCFEVFYSDKTSCYISYLMIIGNRKYNPESLFNVACRNVIHNDIRSVKQEYFDNHSVKGQVKCQETGELSKWEELVVDHRQPNTFSMIVERFKELNNFDLPAIEYTSNEQNHIIFQDESLIHKFRTYHKEKASLRIVKTSRNSSRTGMARIKKTTKDLTIK